MLEIVFDRPATECNNCCGCDWIIICGNTFEGIVPAAAATEVIVADAVFVLLFKPEIVGLKLFGDG